MEFNRCILTEIGRSEILQAIANKTTVTWNNFCIGSGDISETDKKKLRELDRERWEGEITDYSFKDNTVIVHCFVPVNIGGFNITEAGIKNTNGDLVVVVECDLGFKEIGNDELELYFKVTVQDSSIVCINADSQVYISKSDIEEIKKELEEIKFTPDIDLLECDRSDIENIVG